MDKSLLRQIAASDGEPRFSMLETIRDYSTERLIESDEYEPLRHVHAHYFLALAEQAEPELTGPHQADWLARLEGEHDNLRAALGWAREQNAAETALRMAGALWRFWYTRGYLSEGRRWLDQALAMVENGLPVLHTEALSDPSAPSAPANTTASMTTYANALHGAGSLAWAQGDYLKSQAFYEQSLALRRNANDKRGIAASLNNLGTVAQSQQDRVTAQRFYEEALVLFRELGDQLYLARLLNNLGVMAQETGDYGPAYTYHDESLALRRALGDQLGIAMSLANLGEVAQSQGKSAQAIAHYVESLMLRANLGDKEGIAYCLEGLADIAVARGQPKRAARLWGAAETLREELSVPLPPSVRTRYDQLVAGTRASFGAAPFDAAFAAGRSMSLAQVTTEAQTMIGTRRSTDENHTYDTAALPVESTLETGPRLVIAKPDGSRVIPLGRMPLTIGRESNTDIVLDDPRVSRQHARLSYRQQQIWLTDLRSSNGTFVNGTPIQERALQPGDVLSFGGLEATFEDSDAGTRTAQVGDASDRVG